MGLRLHIPLIRPPRPSPARLGQVVQPTPTTRRHRRPPTHQPHLTRCGVLHLGLNPAPGTPMLEVNHERGSHAMPGPGRMRQSARAVFGGLGRRVDRADSAASILAERDNYSQMLAAATGDVIFTTSPAGVITFFNEGAERLLGYRAADVVGRMRGLELHVWDEIVAVAEELGVEPGQAVFTTLAQGAADTREWTFVRADRSHVRVSHTVTTQR